MMMSFNFDLLSVYPVIKQKADMFIDILYSEHLCVIPSGPTHYYYGSGSSLLDLFIVKKEFRDKVHRYSQITYSCMSNHYMICLSYINASLIQLEITIYTIGTTKTLIMRHF